MTDPDRQPSPSRGADLARAALEAARSRNAQARTPSAGRTAGANGAGGAGGAAGAGGVPGAGGGVAKSGRTRAGRQGSGQVAGRMRRRRWSGPGADKARDPQLLGDTVKTWLAGTGAAKQVAKAALVTHWAQIVGPQIADHCTPVSLVDGELLLQAESTAWATQLRMLSGSLISRINAEIGPGTVARIRAKGPTGPSWRFGNRHVAGRGPRDTYG